MGKLFTILVILARLIGAFFSARDKAAGKAEANAEANAIINKEAKDANIIRADNNLPDDMLLPPEQRK